LVDFLGLLARFDGSPVQFQADSMSWLRILVDELHSFEWVAIVLARVAVGLVFFLSGRDKLFVPERRDQMRQTLIEAGVPFPDFNALFVSTVEFACGLLLIIGALTPLASAILGCVMIVAIMTSAIRNIKASCPLRWLAEFLYLPEVLYLVILIWLFFSGPGWLSVDRLFFSRAFL
jgi:putative oxidoreductase